MTAETEDNKPQYRQEFNPLYCPLSNMSKPEVVTDFLPFANRYVSFRAFGHPILIAWRKTFGLRAHGFEYGMNEERVRSEAYEYNMDIQELYERKLMEMKVDPIWTAKKAAHTLISIALSPDSKCSTQVAAAKELNVMFGITIVDENGKTRAARTLEDFYKEARGEAPKAEEAPKQNDR